MGRERGLGRIWKGSARSTDRRTQLVVPLRALATLKTVAGHVEPAGTRWIDVDRQQDVRKCSGALSKTCVIGLQMTTNQFVIVRLPTL